jgi:hypothetical protein
MRAIRLPTDHRLLPIGLVLLQVCGCNAAPAHAGEPSSALEGTTAALREHAQALRRRLGEKVPGQRFTVVVEPPFVVVGDEAPKMVRRRARTTVRWVVKALKQEYFTADPARTLDIFLFKDAASYTRHARALFGTVPSTPFGYYSPDDGALVMNIATGAGTLVHELVHPFIEANFPGCPAWFNEGLGSLYEQTGWERGRIWGYPNWRLPALKQAIRGGQLPSLRWLLSTTNARFYDDDSGLHYAQARYLLYYLQERNLLRTFYRSFLARRAADPTGYGTLKRVLGLTEAEMPAFERRWQAYVLGLTYRGR